MITLKRIVVILNRLDIIVFRLFTYYLKCGSINMYVYIIYMYIYLFK